MFARMSFFILVTIGLFLSSAYGRPNDGYCPENGVYHPHESDCTKFYVCDNNELIPFSCPPPLEWSVATKKCDWLELAGCSASSCKPTDPAPVCPEQGSTTVHLAHQSDCTKFYTCSWGTPILSSCPATLHFNPKLQVCDYPDRAGCLCNN